MPAVTGEGREGLDRMEDTQDLLEHILEGETVLLQTACWHSLEVASGSGVIGGGQTV